MSIITYSVVDINPTTIALTGNSGVLIRHHSTAKATMQAQNGAVLNLDACIIRNGSDRAYGIEGTFANVSSNVFEFWAEDKDGNFADESMQASMVDYVKLTCNAVEGRPDGSGSMVAKCSGSCFSGSFGLRSNTVTVKYRYKKTTGSWSNYANMTVTVVGNSYSASASLSGLDYEAAYDFEYLATDALMSVSSLSMNVTSLPVFHWGENDVTFEGETRFNKFANFNGGASFSFIDSFIRLDKNARCYVSEYSEGNMAIGADTINLNANSLMYNGNPMSIAESGVWTPTISAPGVYWSQGGWYTKVGNIVTVGFHLKVYCDAGYEAYNITIHGLPYTPVCASAGGGMCSGALVQTDKNFQCFVAETNGTITTRAQACMYTSGTALETSASALRYTNIAELTLSGTITYMTSN